MQQAGDGLRDLPRHADLPGNHVQASRPGSVLRRPARRPRLREVPRGRGRHEDRRQRETGYEPNLPGPRNGLRHLPPRRPPRPARHQLCELPRRRRTQVRGRRLFARHHDLRAGGQARDRGVLQVPQERVRRVPGCNRHRGAVQGCVSGVPGLSQGRAPRPARSALRDVPHLDVVQVGELHTP